MREAQLPKNVRQFEIRPEAAAEILECATDLSGKVFHKFCRLQQTLRRDRVPGAVRLYGSPSLSVYMMLFSLKGFDAGWTKSSYFQVTSQENWSEKFICGINSCFVLQKLSNQLLGRE